MSGPKSLGAAALGRGGSSGFLVHVVRLSHLGADLGDAGLRNFGGSGTIGLAMDTAAVTAEARSFFAASIASLAAENVSLKSTSASLATEERTHRNKAARVDVGIVDSSGEEVVGGEEISAKRRSTGASSSLLSSSSTSSSSTKAMVRGKSGKSPAL